MSLAFLLPVAFVLLFANRLELRQSWRWAWLDTVLGVSLFSVVVCEVLGGLGLLQVLPVALLWCIFCVTCLRLVRLKRLPPPPWPGWATLVLLGCYASGSGLTAVLAAPSNWDSMTYHLPRIEHWIANSSLDHYPTSILRQLYSGPAAEFLVLQVRLLHGNDQFVNLVQWMAYISSALAASIAAQLRGASRLGQVAATFCVVTLPMAVLQSSSTQNDLVVALWLLGMICYGLRGEAIGASLCLALGILSKGTAWIFFPPFAIWLLLRGTQQQRTKMIGTGLLAIGLLNLPSWQRNLQLWRNPLGVSNDVRCANPGMDTLASNLVRNLMLEFLGPSSSWNRALEQGALSLHRGMGLDPQLPKANFAGLEFAFPFLPLDERSRQASWSWTFLTHEDYASNPLHMALILWIVLLGRRELGWRFALLLGFITFSALLRWNPWLCRLHLPWLVAACPLLGVWIGHWKSRKWARLLLALLWLFALAPLFDNATRPWFGPGSIFRTPRPQQYLSSHPEQWQEYQSLVQYLETRPGDVGLCLGPNCGEYPLHALLPQRLQHIQVQNGSSALQSEPPIQWVIATRNLAPPYRLEARWGNLSLWRVDGGEKP